MAILCGVRGNGFSSPCDKAASAASRFVPFFGPLQFSPQPGPRENPAPVGCAGAATPHDGGLIARQSGEIPQLDQPGLERMLLREFAQRGIEGNQILIRRKHESEVWMQLLSLFPAAMLQTPLAPGTFDED